MTNPFQGIHYNVIDQSEDSLKSLGTRPVRYRGSTNSLTDDVPDFNNAESAARYYLQQLVGSDERATLRSLTAPERPEVVPDMQLQESRRSNLTGTWTVKFVQTKSAIPVFGSRAVVELDDKRELLSVDASLADVDNVSPIAALSPADALKRIAAAAAVDIGVMSEVQPPELRYYHDDEKDSWHLAYLFDRVPAAPPGFFSEAKSHGPQESLSHLFPELNYLVDAHDGGILMQWSASPTADIPVACTGPDENGVTQSFYGRVTNGNVFELSDPLRGIRTFDFNFKNIAKDPPPADAVQSPQAQFATHQAAVSAHFHAARVYDFCKSVWMRDGIDDKGMVLVSFVNCTNPNQQAPPEWHNAAWWKQRMWYGQDKTNGGQLRSFARHLDIIAHELAHGVTEFTSNLVYAKQSGALNESFSDIFGIIIKNWDWTKPTTGGSFAGWNWQLGAGLKSGGTPLRDLSNPPSTGDPDHMNNYLQTSHDHGGVHTNSNIHNKAAYNVMMAQQADGSAMFTPREVAVLYYLTLTRLGQLATFKDALHTLVNVASTYFAGDMNRAAKLQAINDAYGKVGIQ